MLATYSQGEDKPKAENLRKVRIGVTVEGVVLPREANYVSKGDHEVWVYESEIGNVLSRVEPHPELVEATRQQYEGIKARHLDEKRRVVGHQISWADASRDFTGPQTWIALFYQLHGRTPLPLSYAEVTDETKEPPMREDDQRLQVLVRELLKGIVNSAQADEAKRGVGRPAKNP